MTAGRGPDVAVIGDGPAGSAIAAALQRVGASVVLHGRDLEWPATYGTWIDDVADGVIPAGADIWATRLASIDVRFDRRLTVHRPYGVIDNDALRRELRRDVEHRAGLVEPGGLDARVIVDATGWPSSFMATAASSVDSVGWQTAYGVVLDAPPHGALGEPMLMDFSDANLEEPDSVDVPTFAYALPVADGWLVEETVLVAAPRVAPELLRARLAARLGLSVSDLMEAARRVETVHIPMGAPPCGAHGNVVAFGASAGMINPTTGYSLASSLSNALRVAESLQEVLERAGPVDQRRLHAAVWPTSALRTRVLHDYGLGVLADLDDEGIRGFFSTFFSLDSETWPHYLRIDTPPATMARTMLQMFRRADWTMRRRLLSGDLGQLVRGMIRPTPHDDRERAD